MINRPMLTHTKLKRRHDNTSFLFSLNVSIYIMRQPIVASLHINQNVNDYNVMLVTVVYSIDVFIIIQILNIFVHSSTSSSLFHNLVSLSLSLLYPFFFWIIERQSSRHRRTKQKQKQKLPRIHRRKIKIKNQSIMFGVRFSQFNNRNPASFVNALCCVHHESSTVDPSIKYSAIASTEKGLDRRYAQSNIECF